MQVDWDCPASNTGVLALLRHFATVDPEVHAVDPLPQTHIELDAVPLQVLLLTSLPSPQVVLVPHLHALASQRGSLDGQSVFAAHAAQVGVMGSLTVSHFGVLPLQALLEPHLQAPDAPPFKHVLADSESQMPVSGNVAPVLH